MTSWEKRFWIGLMMLVILGLAVGCNRTKQVPPTILKEETKYSVVFTRDCKSGELTPAYADEKLTTPLSDPFILPPYGQHAFYIGGTSCVYVEVK